MARHPTAARFFPANRESALEVEREILLANDIKEVSAGHPGHRLKIGSSLDSPFP